MIESWIDALTKVFELSLDDGRRVKSYRIFGRDEFPAVIDASDLLQTPVALTIPAGVLPDLSMSDSEAFWRGVTQIHCTPDLSMAHMPQLIKYYGKVIAAVGANKMLTNLVADLSIDNAAGGIEGPGELQYGVENPHWGFLVHWVVKEQLTTTITP